MLDPQMLNASIGYLGLAALNADGPDVEIVLNDFRHCLNRFDAWAESFWTGTALDVEQVFKVGHEVSLSAPRRSKEPVSTTVTACSASGSLTLVHMFEAARFVPIGNTPVLLEPLSSGPTADRLTGEAIRVTIGPSGILEVPQCQRGQRYRVTFFPDVSTDQVKALYASYQDTIAELEGWLRNQWTSEFQAQWLSFSEAGFLQRRGMLQQASLQGIERALLDLWDDIQQLFHLMADLQANSEKLLEYLTRTDLETLLNAPAEAVANALLVLSDEPLLFIYLAAICAWVRMVPPQHAAEVLAEIRTGVLIGLLLSCVTGPLGLGAGLGAKQLSKINSPRARTWLGALSEQLARVSSDQGFSRHAEALKPLIVNAQRAPMGVTPHVPLQISPGKAPPFHVSNPAALARDKSRPTTRLSQVEPRDNAPVQAKNPNGEAADTSSRTATHGCPVSMVTGEELLTLTDAELDGLLPFAFTR
ncbi:hypothetical protein SAMN04487858_115134, partial [Pseudomonas sp. ok602]|uniref:DUF6531 domain-containing protein n=2 Tax=unclassified Pseudomonas TaxID=196821 RepID=UPI0008F27037